MHFLSRFADSSLNSWQVIARASSKWGKIRLNQGVLHLCFKFGDSSLNSRWVIVRTSMWLIDTHTLTDTQTRAMTIPEGQNCPRVKNHRIPQKRFFFFGGGDFFQRKMFTLKKNPLGKLPYDKSSPSCSSEIWANVVLRPVVISWYLQISSWSFLIFSFLISRNVFNKIVDNKWN